jgi:ubiquinone/menaquinone biosynthesis C-methylase UbiE
MKIKKIKNFREVLCEIDGGKVLDVACGEGQFIDILKNSLRSCEHITGLDVNAATLNLAAARFNDDRYSFIQGSSQKIPFNDGTFDLVSLSNGLHHVEDPGIALKEMKRVLKYGKYMVINEMCSDGLTESQLSRKMFHDLRADIDKIIGVSHFYTFTKSEIIRFAENIGLSGIQIFEYTESQDDPMNIDRIREYSARLDSWLGQIGDNEKYDYFYMQVQELKRRFISVGFTNPPQLVILGRKYEIKFETSKGEIRNKFETSKGEIRNKFEITKDEIKSKDETAKPRNKKL